jgi:hypothetical protein
MRTNRRDFLRLSSMAAIAALAARHELLAAKPVDAPSPLLSVGWAPTGSLSLRSASTSYDGASRYRVSVAGGRRAPRYEKSAGAFAVDPIFPAGPVFFWTVGRFSQSAFASIAVPVTGPGGVSFAVKNLPAKIQSPLTIGQRGIYVIALRESAEDIAPNWNRLDLVRDGARYVLPGLPVSHAILAIE